MSLSSRIDNKKKHILILSKGPTQGLEQALAAEKLYSINFIKENTKFCLSFHYNGVNSLSECNWTRTHNHLVRKRTPSHLVRLRNKWLWVRVQLQSHRCSTGLYTGLLKYWNFQGEAKVKQIIVILTTRTVSCLF